MVELRYEYSHLFAMSRIVDAPVHVEGIGDGTKSLYQLGLGQGEAVLGKAYSHKERAMMQTRGMLVRLKDVAVMLKNKLGHTRDNTWLVGTRNQQRNHCILKTHVIICSLYLWREFL